jgi:hypothetical protein
MIEEDETLVFRHSFGNNLEIRGHLQKLYLDGMYCQSSARRRALPAPAVTVQPRQVSSCESLRPAMFAKAGDTLSRTDSRLRYDDTVLSEA